MKIQLLGYASAFFATATLAYFVATNSMPALTLVVAAVFAGLLAWARKSAARLGGLASIILVAIPLVPGLQETRQPQLLALAGASVGLLLVTLRLAQNRLQSTRLPIGAFILFVLLTSLTVGVAAPDQFRMLSGVVMASVLSLGLALSSVATDQEKRGILAVLTVIAVVAAAIAIVESINEAPIYQFTAFQIHTNPLAAFRASSIFGHPLVLCVFLSFVALANAVRPQWQTRNWFNGRLVTIGVPLAGAAVSGSRSIALFAAVGILAVLFMRQDARRKKGRTLFLALSSVALGYFALSTDSALADRFGGLTVEEQFVRLQGWDVVTSITQGVEVWIGGGPRSVTAAFESASGGASFGTVDNQFLTAYADFGILGLAVVVFLAVRVAMGLRRPMGAWDRTMVVGSITCLAAFFVMDPLAWPILALLFGLGAGASVRKSPDAEVTPNSTAPLPLARRT